MKNIFLLAFAAMNIFTAKAQLVTSDATWCNAIERAFDSQGIRADVNCDMNGHNKVLRVAVAGKTASIPLVDNGHNDYSSTICISVEPITMYSTRREYDVRNWPMRSTSDRVDVVYGNPADEGYLFQTLQSALGDLPRVKLIDNNYTYAAANETNLYVLKCNVLNMLRGERYEAVKAKDGGADKKGEGFQRGHQQQKVDRYYAYLEANLQLLDSRNGEIVWQKHVTESDYTSFRSTDPMENCRKDVARTLRNALSDLYPSSAPRASVSGSVIKLIETKKEKAVSLYINLGNDNRLKSGDTFNVYAQYEVGGNMGQEQIGVVQVTDVEGPTLARCKVKKGDKEIFSAVQIGAPLVVASKW